MNKPKNHPVKRMNSTTSKPVLWLIVYLSVLGVAVFYRFILSQFRQTEGLFFLDLIVIGTIWVALQRIAISLAAALCGSGMLYTLARLMLITTNPLSILVIFMILSMVEVSAFGTILIGLFQGSSLLPSTLDWLGFVSVILIVSFVFLMVCTLWWVLQAKRGPEIRKLTVPFALVVAILLLLGVYPLMPTRADRTLRDYLGDSSYRIRDKHAMWACCMIRRSSSEHSATSVYYRVEAAGEYQYFLVLDQKKDTGLGPGTQEWRVTHIDAATFGSGIKPWSG